MLKKQVNIRLEESLINNVTPILSSFGLSISDACRIFLNKVVLDDGIPFNLKYADNYEEHIPNKETIKAMEDAEFNRNLIKIDNIEDLWRQYDND